MCPQKSWFVDYRLIRAIVYLSDGGLSFVDGIGNISLRMNYGVERSIHYWHVPGIKASMISLSTLDYQRYRYHVECGVLKKCKHTMTHIRGSLTGG